MITDARWKLADNQSAILTSANATALLTNIVDMGSVRDVAKGRTLYAVLTVGTLIASAGDLGFFEFGIVTANGSNGTSGEFTKANLDAYALHRLGTSHAYSSTLLVPGTQIVIALSPISATSTVGILADWASPSTGRQFIGGWFGVFTADFTAGAFDVDLTIDPPSGPTAYPIAYARPSGSVP